MTTAPRFGSLQTPAPDWSAARPTRIAILGDFSGGAAAGRLETGAALAARKPIGVEFDTLDAAMARLQVGLTLPLGQGGASVAIALPSLDALHPDALYQQLDVFAAVAGLRQRLSQPATFAAAAAELRAGGPIKVSALHAGERAKSAAPAADASLDDLSRLLGKPIADLPKPQDPTGIDALVREVVSPFVLPAADPQQGALIAAVDAALSDLMRAVLHHPELQHIEALWRGVDFLLRRLETGPELQVHLIDVSAEEFAADLSRVEDLADSGLHRLLVQRPAELADGGYALILGAYELDAAPAHAELLGRMAQIAAQAQAPFVAALSPSACARFAQADAALDAATAQAWQGLRELPASDYLALIAPRFMLRRPYGKRSDPIERFAFEEFDPAAGTASLLWGHPALLVATLLARPDALENGPGDLRIDELPVHHGVDADGDPIALPCTERLLTADAATTLAQRGVMAAVAHKGQPELRLAGLFAFSGAPLGLTLAAHAPRQAAARGRVQDLGFVFKP